MKAIPSTPQQGSTSKLTGKLGGSSAQPATPSPSNKADIYATQINMHKLLWIHMQVFFWVGDLHIQ